VSKQNRANVIADNLPYICIIFHQWFRVYRYCTHRQRYTCTYVYIVNNSKIQHQSYFVFSTTWQHCVMIL